MTSCLSVCLYLLLHGCQLVEQSFMFLHLWRHSSQILRHVIRNTLLSLLQSERLHICVYVWMDHILTDTAPGWESVRQLGPGKSSDIPPLSAADPDAPWPRPSNPPSMHCKQCQNEQKERQKKGRGIKCVEKTANTTFFILRPRGCEPLPLQSWLHHLPTPPTKTWSCSHALKQKAQRFLKFLFLSVYDEHLENDLKMLTWI